MQRNAGLGGAYDNTKPSTENLIMATAGIASTQQSVMNLGTTETPNIKVEIHPLLTSGDQILSSNQAA
jgi:hypothetical protein